MTRSVRRIPKPWSLDELGQVEITPQECLFGMLGTKLAAPKRVAPPEALPAVALPRVVTAAGNAMTPFSSDEAASLCFSTPVASASTPSSVPVALHAPGIGDTMMIADVLPQAGQAVPAHHLWLQWQVLLHQLLQEDMKDQMAQVMKLLPKRQRIFCIINGSEFAHEDDHQRKFS